MKTWGDERPMSHSPTDLYSPGVMKWWAMLNKRDLGPSFFEHGNATRKCSQRMFINYDYPTFPSLVENEFSTIWWSSALFQYSERTFEQERVRQIDKDRCFGKLASTTSVMKPCCIFQWNHIKPKLCNASIYTPEELKERIRAEINRKCENRRERAGPI